MPLPLQLKPHPQLQGGDGVLQGRGVGAAGTEACGRVEGEGGAATRGGEGGGCEVGVEVGESGGLLQQGSAGGERSPRELDLRQQEEELHIPAPEEATQR